MSDDEQNDDLDQLLAEIGALDAALWTKVHEHTASWSLNVGPLHLRAHMGSQRIMRWFVAFCIATFLAGSALTFLQTTKELGIAIIVGAIFAGGSFIIQFWAVQVQQENDLLDALLGSRRRRELEPLIRRRYHLVKQVERLRPGYFDDED